MAWALLSVLQQSGFESQTFFPTASFAACDAGLTITGREPRHLDSWLMPRDMCRQLFFHNSQDADISLLQGQYDCARRTTADCGGGSFDALCQWLDLPRLVLVDVEGRDPCSLLPPPFTPDGILLEGAVSAAQLESWRTTLSAAWRAPVLGLLRNAPSLRQAIRRLLPGEGPSEELCRQLGRQLQLTKGLDGLLDVAARSFDPLGLVSCPLVHVGPSLRLRVAVALDEAFHGYFPDTLDCLEALGMELRSFSPLRSDELPAETDVVYLGCGNMVRYADQLAANHCLKQSIERFASAGGRVYAEGAGLAYLCRQVILENGRRLPMVGALSAVASLNATPEPLRPAIVHLRRPTWLGEAFQQLRGYINPTWQLSPWGNVYDLASENELQGNLVAQRNVIASRMHVNFAAQPHFLQRFSQPLRHTMALV
jgi:cobyrinic acid a,c-diamide synthase